MDHHRWLLEDHPFRYEKDGFYGNIELGNTSTSLSQVVIELDGAIFTYEKGQANVDVDERNEEQI